MNEKTTVLVAEVSAKRLDDLQKFCVNNHGNLDSIARHRTLLSEADSSYQERDFHSREIVKHELIELVRKRGWTCTSTTASKT